MMFAKVTKAAVETCKHKVERNFLKLKPAFN